MSGGLSAARKDASALPVRAARTPLCDTLHAKRKPFEGCPVKAG